jgi:hypothetical protein
MDKVVFHFVLEFGDTDISIEWNGGKTFNVFYGKNETVCFTERMNSILNKLLIMLIIGKHHLQKITNQ